MSLLNPKDVLEESWLLFFLTGLFGLRVVGPRRSRWISYLYAIFLISLYCASFFAIRESIWQHYDAMEGIIYYFEEQKFQGYFSLFIIPALVLSSILKSSDNFNAYKKLDEIDRVLSYLNTPVDHEVEMRKEVVSVCVHVLVTILLDLFIYFSVVTADCGHIFNISLLVNLMPVFLELLTLCAFDTFVEKIRIRFEGINHVIGDLLGPRKISVVLVQSTDFNSASKLRLARRVHLQLHDAASILNGAYGLRLFIIFLATIISVINCSRNALKISKNQLATLDLGLYLIWTFFHIAKYYHLAMSCHAANKEAKLAGGFFFEARLTRGGQDGLNEEARALSRQLINRQLQFTVSNIFSIDFPKGLTVFIAVLIYFLLLA